MKVSGLREEYGVYEMQTASVAVKYGAGTTLLSCQQGAEESWGEPRVPPAAWQALAASHELSLCIANSQTHTMQKMPH